MLVNKDRLKAELDRDGYAVVRGFMSAAEIVGLNQRIDALAARAGELGEGTAYYEVAGRPETMMRLQGIERHDAALRELYYGGACRDLASFLLADEAVPKSLQWFAKPARVGQVTPAHQDGFYFKIEPREAITLWLSLDVIDEENGCVRYLPGSHRHGFRPHAQSKVIGFSRGITDYGDADREAERPVPAAPGDLIIHHCMTVHRADANPSSRDRRALGMVYYAGRAKPAGETEEYVARLMEGWGKPPR